MMHTLLAGVSGSGKSYTEHKLIDKLIKEEAALILIDPKRVELSEYKEDPHVIRYATDTDDCIDCLYEAESTMYDRYRYRSTSRRSGSRKRKLKAAPLKIIFSGAFINPYRHPPYCRYFFALYLPPKTR